MIQSPCLVTVCVISACQNPSATLTHAGEDPVADLAPARLEPLGRDGTATTLDGTAVARGTRLTPSTTSLDRANWQSTTIRQPRGQVEVQPTYYKLFEGFSSDPRATGQYPTVASALGTRGEANTALQDLAAQPVIGIFWLATVPGQVIFLPPWVTVRQPVDGIEWLPSTQATSARVPTAQPTPVLADAPASSVTPTTPQE